MTISLTPFTVGEICEGCTWTVDDVEDLAFQIALVAIGQADHLEAILNGAGVQDTHASYNAIEDAVALLSAGSDSPYHRDGWMFQVMSWLAAHRRTPSGIIRTPHMIKAHKGFDGLQVDLAIDGAGINAVVIFEDKATENPRDVIRNEVWPEFIELEKGRKENVLAAEVTTLLKASGHASAVSAVKQIIWENARSYRVSITVGAHHATPIGRESLFAHFDTTAPGHLSKRRGETLYVPDLRPWLDGVAELAKSKVLAMAA